MTSKNKGGRPKKYTGMMGPQGSTPRGKSAALSDEQNSIIDEILQGEGITPGGDLGGLKVGLEKMLANVDTSDIDNEFVLKALKFQSLQGNVKAIELLGKKLGMFEDQQKETLLDIFADGTTLELNIERMLDVLEDKYIDISVDTVLDSDIVEEVKRLLDEDNAIAREQQITSDPTQEEVCATRAIIAPAAKGSAETLIQGRRVLDDEVLHLPTGEITLDPPIDVFTGLQQNNDKKLKQKTVDDLLDNALVTATRKHKQDPQPLV